MFVVSVLYKGPLTSRAGLPYTKVLSPPLLITAGDSWTLIPKTKVVRSFRLLSADELVPEQFSKVVY